MESTAVYQHLIKNGDATHTLRGRKTTKVGPSSPATRLATGVRRLDDLLGGGLPQGTTTLLHGPPFTGKGVLERKFFLEGLRNGQPSIFLLTDTSASNMSQLLHDHDPTIANLETRDLCAYIDVYTKLIGERDQHHRATYVNDARRWEDVLRVIERTQQQQLKAHPGPSRLVIESISSLMIELGPTATFRFLRTLVGRFARCGGTSMVSIETGMHESQDIETVKHLCRGMISMRENNDQYFLRVEGLPTEFQPGWVEYEFGDKHFELTGSFASGRIRGGNHAPQQSVAFQLTP